jgi:hypothetical protein
VAQVAGSVVELRFNVVENAYARTPNDDLSIDGFIIEAGSAPGLSDLGQIATNGWGGSKYNGTTVWTINPIGFLNVPDGTYYVRVRTYAEAFFRPQMGRSLPSEEIRVVVGTACVLSPPTGLSSVVNGGTVSLSWIASVGCPITRYIIEAGSASGLRDLANFSTSTATSYTASGVGNGTYYVRVRAGDGNNVSAPSNEIVVSVR